MQSQNLPRARLIALIPLERVDQTLGDRKSFPHIGDVIELDQGFTLPNGEAGGIAFCCNADGSVRWVADVLASEIEMLP